MNPKLLMGVMVLSFVVAIFLPPWQLSSLSAQAPDLPDRHHRDLISETLDDYGIDQKPESLITALKEHDTEFVRVLAANKLQSFDGDQKVVAALLEAAQEDRSWMVRLQAVVVLHQLLPQSRILEALKILRKDVEKATEWRQRLSQASILALLGDPSGFKAFEEAFATKAEEELAIYKIWPFLFHTETRVRAKEKIEAALSSKKGEMRSAAIQGIELLISESPKELANWQRQLENLKNDSDPAVRQAAASALSAGRSSSPPLR